MDLIDKISDEIGFSAMGVTTADPLDYADHVRDAIESGRIGSMGWLSRDPDARCDPKSLLPGARSIICCALSYGDQGIESPSPQRGEGRGEGVIARFARGDDYHKVIANKLEKMWEVIKRESPNARAKICVDTSPIFEKALAERAGLGWIGKHTILVNERLGSWFMLGEIITDLELKADASSENKCGNCRICMEACPTGALGAPMKLDARRCLSYLTLEHRGEIPDELCGYIKEGAYGCDICQEVCPHNGR